MAYALQGILNLKPRLGTALAFNTAQPDIRTAETHSDLLLFRL